MLHLHKILISVRIFFFQSDFEIHFVIHKVRRTFLLLCFYFLFIQWRRWRQQQRHSICKMPTHRTEPTRHSRKCEKRKIRFEQRRVRLTTVDHTLYSMLSPWNGWYRCPCSKCLHSINNQETRTLSHFGVECFYFGFICNFVCHRRKYK